MLASYHLYTFVCCFRNIMPFIESNYVCVSARSGGATDMGGSNSTNHMLHMLVRVHQHLRFVLLHSIPEIQHAFRFKVSGGHQLHS